MINSKIHSHGNTHKVDVSLPDRLSSHQYDLIYRIIRSSLNKRYTGQKVTGTLQRQIELHTNAMMSLVFLLAKVGVIK